MSHEPSIFPATVAHKAAAATTLIREAAGCYAPATLCTGFGAEGMVIIDLVCRHLGADAMEVFTIDTGRLPPQTCDLMQRVRGHYGLSVRVYCPDAAAVEAYVQAHGINGFYDGVEQRKECCRIRKVEPLRRALADKGVWITGLRRGQSPSRRRLEALEWDPDNDLFKLSPLLDWSTDEVWTYIRRHDVPYNALHEQGYPSVGCAPCTRAITRGEDMRAGRWWWETGEQKECGLHVRRSAVR